MKTSGIWLSSASSIYYGQLLNAKIQVKRSKQREAEVWTAVWTTDDCGEILSDDFPNLKECQDYVNDIWREVAEIELQRIE